MGMHLIWGNSCEKNALLPQDQDCRCIPAFSLVGCHWLPLALHDVFWNGARTDGSADFKTGVIQNSMLKEVLMKWLVKQHFKSSQVHQLRQWLVVKQNLMRMGCGKRDRCRRNFAWVIWKSVQWIGVKLKSNDHFKHFRSQTRAFTQSALLTSCVICSWAISNPN